MLNFNANILEKALSPWHGFWNKHGLCDDEPSPKVRANKH